MTSTKAIHPDFLSLLQRKDQALVELFCDLRAFVLDLHADANESVYHTHALTSVFSISGKLGDAYCIIPIYTNHLNLGFNKGTLLKDPYKLLHGTGNLMRHIPVRVRSDYRNPRVRGLVTSAVQYAIDDMDTPSKVKGTTVSKIKKM